MDLHSKPTLVLILNCLILGNNFIKLKKFLFKILQKIILLSPIVFFRYIFTNFFISSLSLFLPIVIIK